MAKWENERVHGFQNPGKRHDFTRLNDRDEEDVSGGSDSSVTLVLILTRADVTIFFLCVLSSWDQTK